MTRESPQHDNRGSTRKARPLDDDRLASLLDAALSHEAPPYAAPPGLSQRVLQRVPAAQQSAAAASTTEASSIEASASSGRPGVLARIGPRRASLLALAAAVAALVTFGVLRFGPNPAPLAGGEASPEIAAIERELERLAAAEALNVSNDTIDARIDELALHLDYVDTSDPWADPEAALLEAAVSEALLHDSEEMYLLF